MKTKSLLFVIAISIGLATTASAQVYSTSSFISGKYGCSNFSQPDQPMPHFAEVGNFDAYRVSDGCTTCVTWGDKPYGKINFLSSDTGSYDILFQPNTVGSDPVYVQYIEIINCQGATSLATNKNISFNIYTNITSDNLTINYGDFEKLIGSHLIITNSLGQTMFKEQTTFQQLEIDISTWSKNVIYFVQLIDSNGKSIATRKITLN